jgi:hypothetical protein
MLFRFNWLARAARRLQRLLAGLRRNILRDSEGCTNGFENRAVIRPDFPPRTVYDADYRPACVGIVESVELAIDHLQQLCNPLNEIAAIDGLPVGSSPFEHYHVPLVPRSVLKVGASPTRTHDALTKRGENLGQIEFQTSGPAGFSAITNNHPLQGR